VALDPTARLLFGSVGPLVDQTLAFVSRRSAAEERARLAGTIFELDLEGPQRRRLALSVTQDAVSVAEAGQPSPRATLWLTAEALVRLAAGRFPLEVAEQNGELALEGDRQTALRLNALFPGY
jgi:ubiquinone biosynthesis protein UbiJ